MSGARAGLCGLVAGPLFAISLVLSAATARSQAPSPPPTAGVPAPSANENADPSDDAGYRKAVDDAVREFAAGHFEEARALFKRAHDISPNARTLRGLGMTAFELRFYVQATRELSAALADQRKPLTGNLRAQAQALLERARSFTGVLKLEVEPAKANVLIDGRPLEREPSGLISLDPGTHVVAATAEGYKSTNVRVAIESSSEQTVRIAMEPLAVAKSGIAPIDAERLAAEPPASAQPASSGPREDERTSLAPYAYATLIGAGVFGAGAAAFWLVGDSQYGDLEAECGTSCTDQQIDDSGVKTSDLMTNVFLGLSIASAVASAALFAIEASSTSEEQGRLSSARERANSGLPPARLQARLGAGAAMISGSF